MRYPKYVFLTYGTHNSEWWISQSNQNDDECDSDDIAHTLEFSLAVSYFHTFSGENMFYNTCYDATWALAQALDGVFEDINLYIGDNCTDDDVTDMEYSCSCSSQMVDSTESSRELHSLINKQLWSVNFTGKSVSKVVRESVYNHLAWCNDSRSCHKDCVFQGPIYFDDNGTLEESLSYIYQYRRPYTTGHNDRAPEGALRHKLSLIQVAYIERGSEDLKFLGKGKHILWSGKVLCTFPLKEQR